MRGRTDAADKQDKNRRPLEATLPVLAQDTEDGWLVGHTVCVWRPVGQLVCSVKQQPSSTDVKIKIAI